MTYYNYPLILQESWIYLNNLILSPSALAQNLIQIQSYGFLLNQGLHFCFQIIREKSHQSFRGKAILGSFLMIALRHVIEHLPCSLVNVMDNLAKVSFEVIRSKTCQICKSFCRDLPLPVEVSFSLFNDVPQSFVFLHKLYKGLRKL